MIDFIAVKTGGLTSVTNARSYGGFRTRSDHHPVIADFRLSFGPAKPAPKSKERCFSKYNQPTEITRKLSQSALLENLPEIQLSQVSPQVIDNLWDGFVTVVHGAALGAFGRAKVGHKSVRSMSTEVSTLSQRQKELHIQKDAERDPERRQQLARERNQILHKIRSILRKEGDQFWQEKATEADALRPDARSYYNAIRNIRQLRSSVSQPPVRLANKDGEIMADVQWNLDEFRKYYLSVFHRDDVPAAVDHPADGEVTPDEEPFTQEEVRAAISRQKPGGAVGQDGVSAVLLQAGKDAITTWLTTFFNAVQLAKYCPEDLRRGLIVPIYKPNKPAGFPKSYRPVMLLSVIRKVLTRILTQRCTTFVDSFVPESQAGFRPGRSTADGVFFTRMMCERALLGDWSYSAALLDFSGAFDTIIRQTAVDRLASAGAHVSTIQQLVSETSACVKLGKQLSQSFPTNVGVVQGDPLSPLMYIVYAEGAMQRIREACPEQVNLPTKFTLYADDTTVHDHSRTAVEATVEKCEPIFAEDNLKLNISKTQFVTATKSDASWRSVKLLGSRLGSAEDIDARIIAANRAFSSVSWKRHTQQSRLSMFNCLILPVLLLE
eukprot:scpid42860/ scgid3590/ LINE-1 reverse transcriptase homolog